MVNMPVLIFVVLFFFIIFFLIIFFYCKHFSTQISSFSHLWLESDIYDSYSLLKYSMHQKIFQKIGMYNYKI